MQKRSTNIPGIHASNDDVGYDNYFSDYPREYCIPNMIIINMMLIKLAEEKRVQCITTRNYFEQ